MRYVPCAACRFDADECGRRQSIAAAVREFNRTVPSDTRMTSVKFTCPDRTIGFDPGARVVVDDCEDIDYRGRDYVNSIKGTVLDHRGLKVVVWLDGETSRGKRLLSLYPRPRCEPHGAIGVRLLGERIDPTEARRDMVRATRERAGLPGDDGYFCPDCETFHAEPEWGGFDSGVVCSESDRCCPSCNSTAIAASEDMVLEIEAFETRRGKERT